MVYVAHVAEGPGHPGPVATVRNQQCNLLIYCNIFANSLSDFVIRTDH